MTPWRVLLALIDGAIVAVALLLTTVLHYRGQIPTDLSPHLIPLVLVGALALFVANYILGLYNRVWAYASVETGVAVGVAVTAAIAGTYAAAILLSAPLPLSVWYATWLTCLVLVGGIRMAWRLIRPLLARNHRDGALSLRRVLVYGAGSAGCMLPRALDGLNGHTYQLVGYVDDDPAKRGVIIGHHRVLGSGRELAKLVRKYRIDEVVIAIPSASRERMREIYLACREANVTAKAMPPFLELLEGRSFAPREVRVEDLLGRDLAVKSIELHEDYLRDQVILVTGAGGSIGSELCRQICRYGPRQLLLLGRGENRIHWAYLSLRQRYPEIDFVPLIHSVTSAPALRQVFATYQPSVVFHAAAHKHVYLMERVPAEAAYNNIEGTMNVADLAEEFGVRRFVFISTDKAVAPTSVMGATKRVCELMLTARPHRGTCFVCVRFGNVLGSEGSVLEIFRRQWARREPLTVTHREATRYFMTIPEACFLVLQAGAIGEHAGIYLLDMGQPVSIMKLAEDFILLSGGNPHDLDAIKITGLQPGEKLHESLTSYDEKLLQTEDPYIFQVDTRNVQFTPEYLDRQLDALARCVADGDDRAVRELLRQMTGGYLPTAQPPAGSRVR